MAKLRWMDKAGRLEAQGRLWRFAIVRRGQQFQPGLLLGREYPLHMINQKEEFLPLGKPATLETAKKKCQDRDERD